MKFTTFLLRTSLLSIFLTSCLANLSAADYYWIGGTGNWSDISHWATTSGGVTTHAQAPGSDDDVYFDASSFNGPGQTVTLNTDIIFCQSIDWSGATGTPNFTGGSSVTVMVYGSLELIAAMNYTMDGSVVFTGDVPDNTVNFSGNTAGRNLTFSGGGAWTLTGDVAVDSTLLLNEGTLNTNDRTVQTGYLRSDTDAARTLRLGSSTVDILKSTWMPYLNAYQPISWQSLWIDARNFTLDAGTSVINLRGRRSDLYFEGPGTLAFNEVVLRAPMGSSRLVKWTDQNGFDSAPTVSFVRLDLFHRTELKGSFSFDELELHPGQQYRFESGETFAIGNLIAISDCQGSIDLAATFSGSPAMFSSTGTITTDFTSLSGISAGGGGTFTANNVIDLGENTGWTINARPTNSFFWIGDTGNWNDPMHWSATSGGAASGCVPSLADDVFFDGSSFSAAGQTVTINVENAACRNMSWAGAAFNPVFTGPEENRMQVAGSLAFTPNMAHTFAGSYFFSSDRMGNTITSAGQDFNQDITFEGAGEWILNDSLHVEYFLYLRSGTLRTNDQAVNTNFLWSNFGTTRGLFLGNSYITIQSRDNIYFYSEMQVGSDNLTFDAGTSTIEFTGSYNGGLYAFGSTPLTFNVIIYACPRGSLFQNLNTTPGTSIFAADSVLFYNSGYIGGDNTVNYCYLAPGRTFEFSDNSTQTITELVANGDCAEGYTSLLSSFPNQRAFISLPAGQVFDRLFLQDMEVTGGIPVAANSSVDGGNNAGWTIMDAGSRTLFWVGGEGDWFDRAHWSLISGGAGGACVPTPIDDVVFDGGSDVGDIDFSIFNATDRTVYCRNIDWTTGLTARSYFQAGQMRISGSFTNAGNLEFQSSPIFFYGDGDQTITMGGARFYDFVMRPTGTYTFTDDVLGFGISHQTGTVNFLDQTLDLNLLRVIYGEQQKFLNLGSAHFKLHFETADFQEAFSIYSDSRVTVDPGTSLIELTGNNARLRVDWPIALYDVLFSNPSGSGTLLTQDFLIGDLTANSVAFNGNGNVDMALTTDTLLMAPGKSYVLKAGETQQINRYWQVIGNNCTPISLQASILGAAATASMPAEGEILADFIQMRDITGIGGANFLAGSRSTDIANSNLNWVFETAPEFETVGFLGEDQTLCTGGDVTLNAYNFSPGETYRWQDGSTDTTFTTSVSGTYAVEVTFQTSCVIRDSITVLAANDFEVDLPDDPTICAGDTLILSGDAGINSADYLWQDGSTAPTLSAFTTGQYKLVVDLGGCEKSDSTFVTVTDLPTVALGQDQVACDQEDFTLTANVSAESFQWQDGSMGTTFTNDQPGTYWVEAVNGACPVRDSVMVSYITPTNVDLGTDTTLCIANQFVLDAGAPGYDYAWQDGSGGQTFIAIASGQYFVEIDTAGCTFSDTINLVFPDLPVIDIVDGYEICDGETFRLVTMTPADDIRWDNGQAGPEFVVTVGGNFSVAMDFGSCTVDKPFQVDFLAPPVVELGPDVTECEGIPVILDAGMTGVWQDGTTSATFPTLAAGEYKVVVTNGPCVVADSVNVNFLDAPNFSLGDDQQACEGEVLNVAVTPDNLGFITWDDGLDAEERTFTTTVLHWVDVEDANGCIFRDSVQLTFQAPPELELGQDTTVCDDRVFVLTPLAGPGMLSWPDGSIASEFEVSFPGPVVATLDDGFCLVRDTVVVTLRECLDFKAYLPTAFSPNFDGINDEFRPGLNPRIEIISYRMEVYDRWGGLRFASDEYSDGWDGLDNGRPVEMGVYLYSIELTYIDDRGVGSTAIGGDVTLLK
jgi:gliding motility-associated-like protein